jgi:hypothetical protein
MYRYRKTTRAAAELGKTYMQLYALIRYGKIPTPERDSSGDLIWSDADMARARQALALLEKRRKRPAQETAAGAAN